VTHVSTPKRANRRNGLFKKKQHIIAQQNVGAGPNATFLIDRKKYARRKNDNTNIGCIYHNQNKVT